MTRYRKIAPECCEPGTLVPISTFYVQLILTDSGDVVVSNDMWLVKGEFFPELTDLFSKWPESYELVYLNLRRINQVPIL